MAYILWLQYSFVVTWHNGTFTRHCTARNNFKLIRFLVLFRYLKVLLALGVMLLWKGNRTENLKDLGFNRWQEARRDVDVSHTKTHTSSQQSGVCPQQSAMRLMLTHMTFPAALTFHCCMWCLAEKVNSGIKFLLTCGSCGVEGI